MFIPLSSCTQSVFLKMETSIWNNIFCSLRMHVLTHAYSFNFLQAVFQATQPHTIKIFSHQYAQTVIFMMTMINYTTACRVMETKYLSYLFLLIVLLKYL
jgi:hypothetical protein